MGESFNTDYAMPDVVMVGSLVRREIAGGAGALQGVREGVFGAFGVARDPLRHLRVVRGELDGGVGEQAATQGLEADEAVPSRCVARIWDQRP